MPHDKIAEDRDSEASGTPLGVSADDIRTDSPLVGRTVQVSHYARGTLSALRGRLARITGIVVRHHQMAGFEVDIETTVKNRRRFSFRRNTLPRTPPESPGSGDTWVAP